MATNNVNPFLGYQLRSDEEEMNLGVGMGQPLEVINRKWPGLVGAIRITLPEMLQKRTDDKHVNWKVNFLDFQKKKLFAHANCDGHDVEPFEVPLTADAPLDAPFGTPPVTVQGSDLQATSKVDSAMPAPSVDAAIAAATLSPPPFVPSEPSPPVIEPPPPVHSTPHDKPEKGKHSRG